MQESISKYLTSVNAYLVVKYMTDEFVSVQPYKISNCLNNDSFDSGSNLFSASKNQTAFESDFYRSHGKFFLLSDF